MTTIEFQSAVMEHKDRVHSYARHILRDDDEAQDVAQECLVRLWRGRDRVEPGLGCRNWLLRTTHNLCIDRIRRRAARPEVRRDESAPDPRDRRPDPHRLAHAAEAGRALERALLGLGARERAIVLLREVEGLPYDEIAEMLGLSLGTLKSTLHRTRERLRAALVRVEVMP